MIRDLLTNRESPERIAVIENDREIPYLDLIQKALALQPLLQRRQQEKVAVFLPNGGDYIAAFWGTILSGVTVFPLNVLMTGHEIILLLKQVSVNTVITLRSYRHFFEEMMEDKEFPVQMIYIDEMSENKATAYESEVVASDICPEDPMVLLSTSGTTGKPKIVQLSEKNVEASVLGYLEKIQVKKADLSDVRYILAAPFSSVYGMMILSACLLKSFPIIMIDPVFTLSALYRTAVKHRATHYEGSASAILLMEQMAGRHIPYDILPFTYFGFGGSKVSGDTIAKIQKAYPGIRLFQGYGMTEAAPLIAKHPLGKLEKTGSVGTAIKGVEIAVETENGITHTPYTEGEIIVKGPNVMLGYYNNEAETNRVLKNGYLYTGDIGYLDEEGYLYICGRKKNVIIVRGFNVYPEEVEACIQNSLLAKECYVYGQEDVFGNEMVCADIVPMNPLVQVEAVRAYCSSHLAEYKQPKRISFCENIRKNPSGKTERKKGGPL